MVEIGKFSRLTVTKRRDFGVFLEGERLGEILLPKRDVPDGCKIGDSIDVFIYLDSDDELIATTQTPKACAGEVAYLHADEVNTIGAFLNWGLPKDLLAPYSEQQRPMEQGQWELVYITLDKYTNRLIASSKLNRFIKNEELNLEQGEQVELIIGDKTDLGYSAVINNQHWGMLFFSEVFKPLRRGQKIKGFVKNIREDLKVDLSLQKPGYKKVPALADTVLKRLQANKGFLPLSDKSAPDAIYEAFGVSKKAYKMAIGSLYKNKDIRIEADGIYFIEK
jgi:predicted RNA-binding protein (virulence factor B family)